MCEESQECNGEERQPFKHPGCFAGQLGDCSKKLSREHVVSDSILRILSNDDRFAYVSNMSFQPVGVEQRIPISGLASKVLCSRHNGQLSAYDNEMLRFVAELEIINDLPAGKSQAQNGGASVVISGDYVERWMLKVLWGTIAAKTARLELPLRRGTRPDLSYLRMLYRGRAMRSERGLFVSVLDPRETIVGRTCGSYRVVQGSDGKILGIDWWLYAFRMVLLISKRRSFMQPVIERSVYRPSAIVFPQWGRQIAFQWSEGQTGEPLVMTKSRALPRFPDPKAT